ncbi:MAG: O-antigen ligase family protein [Lentisphaeria bacterium]|nr:O-antigen ligase family protein [Lentisphaeria bacterium]
MESLNNHYDSKSTVITRVLIILLILTGLIFAHPNAIFGVHTNTESAIFRVIFPCIFAVVSILLYFKIRIRNHKQISIILATIALILVFMPDYMAANQYTFQINIPGLLALPLTVITCSYLKELNIYLKVFFISTTTILVAQVYRTPDQLPEILYYQFLTSGAIGVKLFVQKFRVSMKGILQLVFFSWIVQLAYCYFQLDYGMWINGLVGNPNWVAAVLSTLVFPAAIYMNSILKQKLQNSLLRNVIILLVVFAPTLVIIQKLNTRAFIIYLITIPFILVYEKLPKKIILILVIAASIFIIPVITIFIKGSTFERINQSDIRIPLWHSAIMTIQENPIQGTGIEKFFDDLVKHRQKTNWNNSLLSSETTMHVHNEVLQTAMQLGIPMATIMVVFFTMILLRKSKNKLQLYLKLSVLAMIVMSMFDKPLQYAPAPTLFVIMTGLLIPIKNKGTNKIGYTPIVVLASAIFGFIIVYPQLMQDWNHRRARQTFSLKMHNSSLIYFDRAIAYRPTQPHIIYEAAGVARKANNMTKLGDYLDQVRKIDPFMARVNLRIARLLSEQGRNAQALPFFEQEVALYPQSIFSRQWLCFQLMKMGKLEEAEKQLQILNELFIKHVNKNRPFDIETFDEDMKKIQQDWQNENLEGVRQNLNKYMYRMKLHQSITNLAVLSQNELVMPPSFRKDQLDEQNITYWSYWQNSQKIPDHDLFKMIMKTQQSVEQKYYMLGLNSHEQLFISDAKDAQALFAFKFNEEQAILFHFQSGNIHYYPINLFKDYLSNEQKNSIQILIPPDQFLIKQLYAQTLLKNLGLIKSEFKQPEIIRFNAQKKLKKMNLLSENQRLQYWPGAFKAYIQNQGQNPKQLTLLPKPGF